MVLNYTFYNLSYIGNYLLATILANGDIPKRADASQTAVRKTRLNIYKKNIIL